MGEANGKHQRRVDCGKQMKRIRVLVVDDSAVVRQVVTQLLEADPDIEVIGAARIRCSPSSA